MDLSVIIVSYNVRYFLEQCLVSVYRAAENIDCEIFVVDNSSSDGSSSMVSNKFPDIRLINNHENRGFSAANNQAIKLATGRYILLLNPDTLVGEETFSKCISFMDRHPETGATGVKMINGKGRLLPESKRSLPTPKTAFYKMAGLSYLFPRSELFSKYYLGNLDSTKTTQADIISGAFMFIRREAVIKTGYLDEAFFMYGEDIDYSYRLLKAGFKNYYLPETKIIHFKGESTKKENLSILISFYKAMTIFVLKHFNHDRSKILICLLRAAIFLRAGLSLVKQFFRRVFLPVFNNIFTKPGRTVIVSDTEGYIRVCELLKSAGMRKSIAGRIAIYNDTLDEYVLGKLDQIRETVRNNRIREVIFISGQLDTSQIIDTMDIISDQNVTLQIMSEEGKYIIGSGYVNNLMSSTLS
jgi:GT2 family glycosyltransferase